MAAQRYHQSKGSLINEDVSSVEMERVMGGGGFPGFMAATASAKAKIKGSSPGKQQKRTAPIWNSSTRTAARTTALGGGDSSSSGGTQRASGRSPGHRRWGPAGYSPESSGADDRTPPYAARRRSTYL